MLPGLSATGARTDAASAAQLICSAAASCSSPRFSTGRRSSSSSWSTSASLVLGGAYVVTRFGLADLEAGYALDRLHGQVGETLRA